MSDDTLRQCLFRGVPFYADSFEDAGGRRLSINELPFQDKAYIQDMGKQNGSISLSGYIIGDICDVPFETTHILKNNLIVALEKQGAGLLELPFHQERLSVFAGEYSFSGLGDASNKIDFSVTFTIETQQPVLITATQRQIQVFDHNDNFQEFLLDDLLKILDFRGKVFYLKVNAEIILAEIENAIRSVFNSVSFFLPDKQRDIKIKMENLSLETYPDYFTILSDITASAEPQSALSAFIEISDFQTIDEVDISRSLTKQQDYINQRALSHAFKQSIIANLATIITQAPLETRQQAVYYRALLSDLLDDEYPYMGAETYNALTDLTNETATYLTENMAILAPIVTIEGHTKFMPATWWSYRLYGNIDKAEDLIKRNNIADPDFMPLSFEAVAWE